MPTRSICFRTIVILLISVFYEVGTFGQSVRDIDGNTYLVIQAGRYQWMAENLRVMHDPQGNTLVYHMIENPYLDTSHYGFLYSWATAMDSSDVPGVQGICPEGWHLPTDAEWDSLTEWAGGIEVAGMVLKRQGPGNFGVLMSGNFNPIQEKEYYFGEEAYYWTSDAFSLHTAWMRHFGYEIRNINRSTVGRHYGFSIRCVRGMN
jgi:uncharacterized protein (TIGR02145 family)